MTLRWKIFGLSAVLIALFVASVGVSVAVFRETHDEIGALGRYHVPLQNALSNFDLQTSDYERLIAAMLLRHEGEEGGVPLKAMPDALESSIRRMEELSARIERLLADGAADPANDLHDRLVFAELRGSLALVRAQLGPYHELGRRVVAATVEGEVGRAVALSRGFAAFNKVFDVELGKLDDRMSSMMQASTTETHDQMNRAVVSALLLLALAAAAWFGLSAVLSGRILADLGTLLEGTRQLDSGNAEVVLPVRSRDEIGQLTQSFNRMTEALRAKDRIRDTFGKYIDPRVVSNLIEGAGDQAAERRVITVFFSDIEGFTSMSEALTAQVMVRFLNEYFTVATDAIRAHNGLVDKYIGDAVMAFWTPPFSTGDVHATDACLAALAQQRAIEALRADLPNILGLRRNLPNFSVRMGMATGEAVIGTIGSPTTKSYTAIGDTVNLATRLEGLNKAYGTSILISEDTWRLAQQALETRELDRVLVAGKTEPIRIFEVMAAAGELPPERAEMAETFAAGLARYRERAWSEADRLFADCLALVPGDGPAAAYRRRIAACLEKPPPEDWDGVWRFGKQ